MTYIPQWKPIPPELPYGDYRVLFDGGTEGVATLNQRGWVITQDSAFRSKESGVVAYKHLEKIGKWVKK